MDLFKSKSHRIDKRNQDEYAYIPSSSNSSEQALRPLSQMSPLPSSGSINSSFSSSRELDQNDYSPRLDPKPPVLDKQGSAIKPSLANASSSKQADKMKSQRVRFPVDNNPSLNKIHLPTHDEQFDAATAASQLPKDPRRSRSADALVRLGALHPLPQSQDSDNPFDDSKESGEFDTPDDLELNYLPAEPSTAHFTKPGFAEVFSTLSDMGIKSSTGLVPGTNNMKDRNAIKDVESYPGSQFSYPLSETSTVATSPKLPYDNSENSIPLLELHRKLDLVAKRENQISDEARTLVRNHSRYGGHGSNSGAVTPSGGFTVSPTNFLVSGGAIDADDRESDPLDDLKPRYYDDNIEHQPRVKQGILGSLLRLYANDSFESGHHRNASSSRLLDGTITPGSEGSVNGELLSGSSTPKMHSRTFSNSFLGEKKNRPVRWYNVKSAENSTTSLGELIHKSSKAIAAPGQESRSSTPTRPTFVKRASNGLVKKKANKRRIEDQAKITVHISDVLHRQRFILRLCHSLMLYGAPTHRLEEYMKMTSRVLEIEGQFIYIPGCMIVSFDDITTHTSQMQLVRCVQGLNLSKLHEIHQIYKVVVHDLLGVEEASVRLDKLVKSKNLYPPWLCVLFFGFASAMVSPMAFGGRWLDMPIAFLLGSLVGLLQHVVAPRLDLYNNVFEVTSAIAVSFLGRAFGSIRQQNQIFCFAGIAQGALALILPGYIICKLDTALWARSFFHYN